MTYQYAFDPLHGDEIAAWLKERTLRGAFYHSPNAGRFGVRSGHLWGGTPVNFPIMLMVIGFTDELDALEFKMTFQDIIEPEAA